MRARETAALIAVAPLFVVMAVSFVGMPWPTEIHEIPVYDRTGDQGIANALFGSFPFTILLIALILGSAMIGGIYLAKMEHGEVGP